MGGGFLVASELFLGSEFDEWGCGFVAACRQVLC